jgi:hypothetical protein
LRGRQQIRHLGHAQTRIAAGIDARKGCEIHRHIHRQTLIAATAPDGASDER